MFLEITGSTKKKRELAGSITEFCATKLMTTRLANTLEINIELVNDLAKKEGVYGDCIWEDKPNRPKEFTIRADSKLAPRHMIETIAHEMVHVKQWAKGEMQELVRQSKTRFNGTLFGETEYWDRPWEIEAHGREKGLFVRWAETTGKCNEAWTQENLY